MLIYSSQVQADSVAVHKQRAFTSAHTNTQLTLPNKALSKTLCFLASSPAIIQLQGISQKASYFHFQLRGQSQVFGGEIRTYTLLPSHLWLGLQSPLFSWGRGRRGWHPYRSSSTMASTPAVPWESITDLCGCLQSPFHSKSGAALLGCPVTRVQLSPVQYPWRMSCSYQRV